MNETKEALQIWSALKPMISKTIDERTKSCVRSKKMNVVSAPNGTTIGVREPFDTITFNIPYSSAVSSASVGDTVWVQWYYDNASTMLAVSFGDGDIGFFPEMGSNINADLNNATLPGVYQYLSSYENKPSSTGGAMLVIRYNANYISQIAFCNSPSYSSVIYARHYNQGTWGDWARLQSSADYPYPRSYILNSTASVATTNDWADTGLTASLEAGHLYAISVSVGSGGGVLGVRLRTSSTINFEHTVESGQSMANLNPVFYCNNTNTCQLWVKRAGTGSASYAIIDIGNTQA